jgi:hypothetical protein
MLTEHCYAHLILALTSPTCGREPQFNTVTVGNAQPAAIIIVAVNCDKALIARGKKGRIPLSERG